MMLAQQGVPDLPESVCALCNVFALSFTLFLREGRLFLVGPFLVFKI